MKEGKDQFHKAVASRAHGVGVLLKKWRTSETIVKFQAFCSDTELSRLDLSAETSGMRGRERVRENDKYSIFYWEYISDHTSAQQKNILWPTIIPMIHMNRNMNVRIKWECSEIRSSPIVLLKVWECVVIRVFASNSDFDCVKRCSLRFKCSQSSIQIVNE